jgi:AraC family transcriptional regulator
MDWLTRMNAAIAYVEDNLDGDVDYEAMARIACCSTHNFFRMFSFITDASLADYIRRRRLTLAALELRNSDVKVIDLALKWGYDSPVSFSRAFALLHGVTPTEARTEGVTLKAYPKISFNISIKGEKEMDYRIETKEAFTVFGIEEIFKTEAAAGMENTGLRSPKDLWDDSHANGAYEQLFKCAVGTPAFMNHETHKNLCKVNAVCDYRDTGAGTFPYMLFAFAEAGSKNEGYTLATIPAHTWAIFPSEKFLWKDCGTVIEKLYKRIFSEWLPTSNYEQVGSLDMELHVGDNETGNVEIWLAVKKKA